MILSLDTDMLGKQMLPPFLRKDKMLAWVRVLLAEVGVLNTLLLNYRTATRDAISYNGQTMVLEAALNARYEDAAGGIYIQNDAGINSYVFYGSENQGSWGYTYFGSEPEEPTYTYFGSESVQDYDFIVMVPAATTYNESEMRGYVNNYRIAGKTFSIETY